MNVPLRVLALALLLSSLSVFGHTARSRVLLYGDDPGYPPYMFIDEQGRPAGFHVELLQAVAAGTGIEVSFRPEPWSDVYRKMMDGELDITSMIYTPERDRLLDFSLPHSIMYASIFTRSGAPPYTADLKGRRIALQESDRLHDYALAKGWGDTLTLAASEEESLALLADGKVDFVLGYHIPGLYWIRQNGWKNIRIAEPHLMETSYCFAVQEGNSDLLVLLDDGLRKLKETGEYKAIYDKWLGGVERAHPIPLWFWIACGGIGSTALLLFAVTQILQRQVKNRTAELHSSEERFTLAATASGIGVWDRDIVHNQMIWDERMCELYGTDLTQFAHPYEAWMACIHPDDRAAVRQAVKQAELGEKDYNTEFRIVRPDGQILHLHAFGKVLRAKDGTPLRIIGTNQDITARVKAKKQLQMTQFAFDHSADAIFWINADASFFYVNEAACKRLGYTRDELLNMSVPDIDPEFPAEKWPKFWQNLIRQGSVRFESTHQTKTGETFPVELFGNVIQFKEKEFCCTYAHDITERKQSQQALENAHQLLRNIIDSMADRVWWKDLDSRFLGCNILVAHDAGLDHPDQMIGKTDFDMCWADQAEAFIGSDRRVIESGVPILYKPERQVQEDGSIRWIEVTLLPLKDTTEKIVGTVGTYTDITERTEAEAKLRRLSTAIEQSPDSVVITDPDGVIQSVNPAFEKMNGYSSGEACGRNICFLESGEHDPAFYSDMWETIQSGGIWKSRFVNKRKNGTHYTSESVISPIKTSNGAITSYVGISRDITEQLERDEQIRQIEKMEVVGQLAGGIAHDFNNILQAILGFSELLLPVVEKEERPLKHVLEIQKAAGHAADLTKQMLAFSRKQPVKIKSINLNTAITETKEILISTIGESVHLFSDLQSDLHLIQADEQQAKRIIINLVVNARDAMPDGGQLTLRTRNVTFSDDDAKASTKARAGDFVCLSVNDTGTGMSENVLSHIFEPFFTTKAPGKGTGLGLASIYGIAQTHHGWVNVDSKKGSGSTFEIYFPVSADEFPTPKAPDSQQRTMGEVRGNGERILIVEDDPLVQHLSAQTLQSAGYTVTTATSAEEALEIFEKAGGAFDLLFSDVILPNQNGADLAATLRKIKPNLPILLCSGYSGDRIRAAGIDQKEFFFLEKPFLIVNLLSLVQKVFLYNQ